MLTQRPAIGTASALAQKGSQPHVPDQPHERATDWPGEPVREQQPEDRGDSGCTAPSLTLPEQEEPDNPRVPQHLKEPSG